VNNESLLLCATISQSHIIPALKYIDETFFGIELNKQVYLFLRDYYVKYKKTPSPAIIKESFPDFQYAEENGQIDFFVNELIEKKCERIITKVISKSIDKLKTDKPSQVVDYINKEIVLLKTVTKKEEDIDIAKTSRIRLKKYIDTIKSGLKEITGIPIGIPEIDNLTCGFHNGELISIIGQTSVGKCVTRDTLLFTEDGIVEFDKYLDSSLFKKKGFVLNKQINIYGKDGIDKTKYIYYDGKRKIKQISTKAGYFVKGTDEHPILVFDGREIKFKKIKDLKINDYIVIQRNQQFWKKDELFFNFKFIKNNKDSNSVNYKIPEKMNKELARFLGYIVAEGFCGKSHSKDVYFCSWDDDILQDYKNICFNLFGWNNLKEKNEHGYNISSIKIRKFLLSIGLGYTLSGDKEIPWSVLQSKKEYIIEFLKAYFEGECSIGSFDITATSKSFKLIHQIHVLLLNFGVISRMTKFKKKTPAGKLNDYYNLKIDISSINTFINDIGFISERRKKSVKEILLKKSKDGENRDFNQIYFDRIPFSSDMINELRNERLKLNNFLDDKEKELKLKVDKVANKIISKKRTITYDDLNFMIEFFKPLKGKNKLYDLILDIKNSNYFFDKIKEIKEDYDDVYDFFIPKSHSFFSNGFVSHNSWSGIFFAINAWLNGFKPLFISLEMNHYQLSNRFDALVSGVSPSRIKHYQLNHEEFQKYRDHLLSIREGRPKFIVSNPAKCTTTDIFAKIVEYKPDICFIDYVSLIEDNMGNRDTWEKVGSIMRDLKNMTRDPEINIPIVVLAQVNRGFERASMELPELEDVAHSYAISAHSDIVMALHQNNELREEKKMLFGIIKNRDGEILRDLRLHWDLNEAVIREDSTC